jgi:hypothetical protein
MSASYRNRATFAVLLAAAVSMSASPAVLAAPLSLASSALRLEVTGDALVDVLGPAPIAFSTSNSYTTARGSTWVGAAAGSTGSLAGRPFAGAATNSFSSGNALANAPGFARSGASLRYLAVVNPIALAPIALPFVPVTVAASATLSVNREGDPENNEAVAVVVAEVNNFTLIADLLVSSSPGLVLRAIDERTTVFSIPGLPMNVLLRATASSESGLVQAGPFNTFAIASSFVDPVFGFDQELFDEIARMQGFQSFELSQYFAFDFSPPFDTSGPQIPEPGSMALVIAGAMVIGARRVFALCSRAAQRACRPRWRSRLPAWRWRARADVALVSATPSR